jgi:hypothetical protein
MAITVEWIGVIIVSVLTNNITWLLKDRLVGTPTGAGMRMGG